MRETGKVRQGSRYKDGGENYVHVGVDDVTEQPREEKGSGSKRARQDIKGKNKMEDMMEKEKRHID